MDREQSKNNRYRKIRAAMADQRIDVILFSNLPTLKYVGDLYQNLAWYVNTAILFPAAGEPFVIAPLSDKTRIRVDSWIPDISTWNPSFLSIPEKLFETVVMDFLRDNGLSKGVMGIERSLNWNLVSRLRSAFPDLSFVAIDDLIQDVMVIKDEYEIDRMKKVAKICDSGFEEAKHNIRPGMTENELAGIVELRMRKEGCNGYWVPNQVGTGKKVLMDHYPTETVIEPGHYVKIGLHPVFENYCGDICNIFALAKPEDDFQKMCEAVEAASNLVVDAMRPGVKSSELFRIYYDHLAQKGYHNVCNWFIGHGLGTGHLKPLISPNDHTILQENMIIILNALAQPEGKNGFMNEIMLLVRKDGAERLSMNPLSLEIL